RDPDLRPPTAPALRRGRCRRTGRRGAGDPRDRRLASALAHRLRLAAGYREVRGRGPSREDERNHAMIRFLSPWWLLALLPVLALAGAYIWRQRQRRAF